MSVVWHYCDGISSTGSLFSHQVVQVYLKWLNATGVPQLQLAAVQRTFISTGQQTEVSLV